jgi:hypothetical protein
VIEERDPGIERITELLRPLPLVRPTAVAGLLVAVAAEREREREGQRSALSPRARRWIIRGVGAAIAAGLVSVLLLRGDSSGGLSSVGGRVGGSVVPELSLAARGGAAVDAGAPQVVELVLRAPSASQVHVAGDFNGWNQHEAPMRRDSASGLWSATLTLRPGRHVYAFVVDDTLWVPDPRAPSARDADYGRPGSVLLVGRP